MVAEQQFDYDVFLSHASADKAAVRELAERLKGDGLRVWLDEWVIQPGDSIPLAIEQGLESSRTLVLVMSQAAFDSEWVTLERHTALFRDPTNQQRRFIPLRLDDCRVTGTLGQFAYADWRESNDKEYERLLTSLRGEGVEDDFPNVNYRRLVELKRPLVSGGRFTTTYSVLGIAAIVGICTTIAVLTWLVVSTATSPSTSGPNSPVVGSGDVLIQNSPGVVKGDVKYDSGLDEETIKRILNKYHRAHTEDRIAELRSALEAVRAAASHNNDDAVAALVAARHDGDLARVQKVLIQVADRKRVRIEKENAEFLELCREIATIAFIRGDFEVARARFAMITNGRPDDFDAINRLANLHFWCGDATRAEEAYEDIVRRAEKESIWAAKAHCNLGGLIFHNRGEYEKADLSLQEALTISQKGGYREVEAVVYNGLGSLAAVRDGDYEASAQMKKKVVDIFEELAKPERLATSYASYGNALNDVDRHSEAEQWLLKAISTAKAIHYRQTVADAESILGEVYTNLQRYEEAETKLESALATNLELGLEGAAADCYRRLAFMCRRQEKYDEAKTLHLKSLAINMRHQTRSDVAHDYFNLGVLAKESGNANEAKQWLGKARKLYDELDVVYQVKQIDEWFEELESR